MHPILQTIQQNVRQVIIGKDDIVERMMIALLSEGHVLLEDVPGVGKTVLVRSVAESIGATFHRIQFTPDLLPTDIIGVSIFNEQTRQFEFKKGPIHGSIVVADELNRASPKTQSALLESMEERAVTVDGVRHTLPDPFFVMATQNPSTHFGTYPLPEAQLDRFLFRLTMGYPTEEEEVRLLQRHVTQCLERVTTLQHIRTMREEARDTYVSEHVQRYIVSLVRATREHEAVEVGVSPRGTVALQNSAKAYAYLQNRSYVLPDDVQSLFSDVVSHRIQLTYDYEQEVSSTERVVEEVLRRVEVPVGDFR